MVGIFGEPFGGTVLGASPGFLPPIEAPEGEAPPPVEALSLGSLFAEDVYRALEPMAVRDQGFGLPLAAICSAIGGMFKQAEDAVRALDGFDAQTQTWDIDRAPDFLVSFIGQSVGVRVTPGIAAETQRAQVREGRQWKRGRLDQLAADIRLTLTGKQRVTFVERFGGSAWKLEIITSPEETPSTTATEKAALVSKPGGIVALFALSTVPKIDEATRTIDALSGTIDGATLANWT